ncbi:MAG TPA: DNA-directed RNA polymerase subunit beta [Bacteroidota bacterium]|nr:DNA-directed RNA polymerase subunit beta [Bacteroidota bacterium]
MKNQSNGSNGQDNGRVSFAKIPTVVEYPDLLNVQMESFEHFLQEHIPPHKRKNKGLQQVFMMNFPISDTRENYLLEFMEYYVEKPKYSMRECQERGLTYAVPLKAKLRLSSKAENGKDFSDTIEEVVYLGNLPYMTDRGTFIINGAERVIVSQLHRSPGVFFGESVHPNGTPIFSARIIPFRGSWVEFTTDINNVMYAYIDRKKKFPVTTLLRALGYSSDDEILELFGLVEEVKVADIDLKQYLGRIICGDIVDRKTGEIIINKDATLSEDMIKKIKKAEVKKIRFLKSEETAERSVIANTIQKDSVHSEEDALEAIYRQLRSGDAPDLDTAKNLIDKLFFNPKRYDLGDVGRHRLNSKLKLDIPLTTTTLTKDDIIAIIKYLLDLQQGKTSVDDIDHLGNRRVRTVGEQIAAQFNVGLSRMCRTVRERMNIRDQEAFTPADLVNARTITSVINAFFGTNQLSQYMDQTNPLAELTNKRRMSALGPGGLTRERAGFEVRDVHYTHYGRLCPIETPEGPNIGLISSLCMHARVNEFGFIETPYRPVRKGKVSESEIEYLNAEQEDEYIIAQANVPLDERNRFKTDRVTSRHRGDFVVHPPDDIQYMDVAPTQIVSAAAALIPFLEHDDANRALMGSNMQRQSVPLLRPAAPIVGTGLEEMVARDSRTCVIAERAGVVENVSGDKITVVYDIDETNTEALVSFEDKRRVEYYLTKFFRTNQDTCINQKAIVVPGQRFKKGEVLADGCATDRGELALGRNVLVAFMPWRGYNFEDAIIMNERIVSEDVYTSIHIEEFELQVRDTKRGEEELTREIPNVSEEATKDLDENGIIRVGAEVKEGDILIGKITPKGETDPTPEEKLLKAIFGEKAGDVKDASLKAPPGMKGIVIETKLFSRKKKDAETKKDDKKHLDLLEKQRRKDIKDHYEKLGRKLDLLLNEEKSIGVRDKDGNVVFRSGTQFKEGTFSSYDNLEKLDYSQDWVDDKRKNNLLVRVFENYFDTLNHIEEAYKHEKNKIMLGDELPPGIVQLAKVYVAKKRKLSVGDKMAGRHGNKGVVAAIVPREDMPFMPDGTPVDIVLNPLGVPSRMNLGQLFETALGWAGEALGVKFSTPIFDGASWEDVQEQLKKANLHPESRSVLFDGRTGERFDQEVTVGFIYMMKLSHLVDDKIHARSIGPYSLITQQPLGGKAQFGGQRFGEMEVWALQGYGASHVLQEILTVKSDDVVGRAKVYEAIVKGDNLPEANIPESFNVLIRELQGLGLEMKIE